MGSMTSSPLSLVGVIVAAVFGVVHGQLVKRQERGLQQLKAVAPHILKPTKTPQQLAYDRSVSWSHGLMTAVLVIGLIVVSVLSGVYNEKMAWSFWFDTETYSQLYDILRYIGLFWIGVAGVVFWRSHVSYLGRISYVTPYWQNIPSNITLSGLPLLYVDRNDESDLESLRSDVYRFVRDPQAAANRLFAIGIVFSSCSWLLCLICGAMGGAEQFLVIKRDMEWALLYGPIYDTYRVARGGQFLGTCFNQSETRCEQSIRNKQAELSQPLNPTNPNVTTTQPPPARLLEHSHTYTHTHTHTYTHPPSTSHVVQVHPHASV